MYFAYPAFFLLFLLLIPYIMWYFFIRPKKEPSFKTASVGAYINIPKTVRQRFCHLPAILHVVAFSMLVVALARPQSTTAWNKTEVEGIEEFYAKFGDKLPKTLRDELDTLKANLK